MPVEPSLFVSLAGGVLVGSAAGLLLLLSGRISGVTGIVAGAMSPPRAEALWRGMFLLGLVIGGVASPIIAPGAVGGFDTSWPVLVVAGFLVGWGARFGGGCTSGHGVCGVGRLSGRSIVGCAIFMLTGMAVVFLTRHVVPRLDLLP